MEKTNKNDGIQWGKPFVDTHHGHSHRSIKDYGGLKPAIITGYHRSKPVSSHTK